MGIFPRWLEKKEDLRYISDNVIELDLTANVFEFVLSVLDTSFNLSNNQLSFQLASNEFDFNSSRVIYKLTGAQDVLEFIFTKVEC